MQLSSTSLWAGSCLIDRQCFCSSFTMLSSRIWSSGFLACQTWQTSPRSPILPDSRSCLDSLSSSSSVCPPVQPPGCPQCSCGAIPLWQSSASCRICTQLQLDALVSTQQSPEPIHSKEHSLLHGCFTGHDAFLHSLLHTEADEVDQEDPAQQKDFV